jgi:alkylated DNA repair dioxygenase AlkB
MRNPVDLFAPAISQPIVDAEGGVRYWHYFAEPREADPWFEALRANADWHTERRQMFDHVVDVPRMFASYRIDALPSALPLAEILDRVQEFVPAPYTSIGLNLYRGGRDSVAMHNDKLHTIVPKQPIALVSLGSSRRMVIRAKTGDRRSIPLDLAPGSLLAMSHASQLTHEHGIPKTTYTVGPRISVVFRVRPVGRVADY